MMLQYSSCHFPFHLHLHDHPPSLKHAFTLFAETAEKTHRTFSGTSHSCFLYQKWHIENRGSRALVVQAQQ
jgi:hypothetical protein